MDYKRSIYIMMEANYLKELGRELDGDNSDLFPYNWYLSNDYVLKTEILYEAIKTKKRIIETDKYQQMIEGVK